jgi:hypothetical protein
MRLVDMSLTTALETLARKEPTPQEQKQAVADVLARCSELETKLGLPHKTPIPTPGWAARRLTELESLAGHSPATTTPATTRAAAPVKPTVAKTAATVVNATVDDGVLTVRLAEYLKMDAQTRREFCQNGGAMTKTDFDAMTIQAKSQFCRDGGRLIDEGPAKGTAAKSFGH